ncbi:MAG: penicillin-binding protein 2 [Chloroflexi bacterium]|nr:penicillin-binding protein 2 [Chloroflexota bacterium]
MRRRRRSSNRLNRVLIFLVILVGALVLASRTVLTREGGFVSPLPLASAPPPTPTPLPARMDPQQVTRQFFQLWGQGQYDRMYGMLSESSRAAIPQDRFVTRYRNIASGVGITSVSVEPGAPQQDPSPADSKPALSKKESAPAASQATSLKVPCTVTLEVGRFGRFTEQNGLPLVLEGDAWRVEWSPSLIFRGLSDENSVRVTPADPVRGSILDRNGKLLAEPGKVLDVGVVPGQIKDESKVLAALSGYLGIKPESIKARYANAKPDWWVPLKELPLSKQDEAKAKIGGIGGIGIREKEERVYPYGSLAAHAVGYVSAVSADDLKKLAAKGYEETDVVGRQGLEATMEEVLAGQKGGTLTVVGQDGKTVRTVAERKAKPGGTVRLTIDIDVQRKAEEALGDKAGSIVVIDPRDHSILALASHPAFDPGSFILGLSDEDWKKLSEDKRLPFQNRPVLSAYPTGSVFKVVTMAAGLEKGGFRPDSQFDSPGQWTLPGTNQVFRDWIPQGHGRLSLMDGLAQSANPVFYEIGYKLNSIDSNLLPSYAKEFGFGAPTGLVGLPENAGTLPSPEWKKRTKGQDWYPGDAVNLAIGQGYLEATPLQMANLYAALADGGNLRSPLLVKSVSDGTGTKEYSSEPKGKLPVSQGTQNAIREGMKRAAADPKGTANYAFKGFRIPTAAKTGSAENQSADAHAWFAGYAPADQPEVVIIVMIEGGRAGGEVAAPPARKFLESYFAGR